MRPLVVGIAAVALAACTLLVPIDDDLSIGVGAKPGRDGGKDTGVTVEAASDAGTDADATRDAQASYDAGELFGPAREGCPNGVSLDPDLAAYYPFDETAGSILHDCSRKQRDLPSLSAVVPKWSDGHIQGAADFDGIEGCFGSEDTTLNAFEGQPFSISFWIFPRQLFDATNNTGLWIVSHKVSPKGWHIGVDDPDRIELDLEWVKATVNQKTEISAKTEISKWVHFVATYSQNGEGAVYKNGVLTQKQGADKVPVKFEPSKSVFFRVGCRGLKSGTFDGKIDELRIYPSVITEEKIRELAAGP